MLTSLVLFGYLVVRSNVSCSETFNSHFHRHHTLLLGRFLSSDLGLGCYFYPLLMSLSLSSRLWNTNPADVGCGPNQANNHFPNKAAQVDASWPVSSTTAVFVLLHAKLQLQPGWLQWAGPWDHANAWHRQAENCWGEKCLPIRYIFSDYQNAMVQSHIYIVQWLALIRCHSAVKSSLPCWIFT